MASRMSQPLRSWAGLSFGMGSILIFTGILAGALFGDAQISGGPGPLGGLSLLGVAGAMLWVLGLILLVIRIKGPKRTGRRGPVQVLLRGRERYRCTSCKRWMEVSGIDYHRRVRCDCGEEYDMFQDTERDIR